MQTIQAERPNPGDFQNERIEVSTRARELATSIANQARKIGCLADPRVLPAVYDEAGKARATLRTLLDEIEAELSA